ncbi:MAG: L,D-transpeptidase [Proteobacteria bacterium]|nr:L,D-transpeptidase [Pseudomonadota bacterium]
MSTSTLAQSWAPWAQKSLFDEPATTARAPKAKPANKKATARASVAVARKPATSFGVSALSSSFDDDEPSQAPQGPIVVSGGPRPSISPKSPDHVHYVSGHAPGSIVIDTRARKLYLIQSASTALVYPIAVGKEGFSWTGTEKISRTAQWPDWHPPAEMRERVPTLPTKMTGGINNPLGARALYLGNTLYRIHGTSDAKSIGRAASSGCFRMHNRHVVDLYQRVGVGTRVYVIHGGGSRQAAKSDD